MQTMNPRQNAPKRTTKRPAPPEGTHAEAYYFVKQMQGKTPIAVKLRDGEIVEGSIEWYDRDCIKLRRDGEPNLLIYKDNIQYLYKPDSDADDSEE